MQVILLERVPKLGQMGEVVNVRPGYARNFLVPQGKALRASKTALESFERRREDLEAANEEARTHAEIMAGDVDGRSVVILRQASESKQLYGSVSARDVVAAFAEADDPALAHGRLSLVGHWVLWTGRIPRGRGQAPERTRPAAGSLQQVRSLLAGASEAFERLAAKRSELEAVRARIDHPYFGRLLPKHWLRFVELHHDHHLAIIRDILDQG